MVSATPAQSAATILDVQDLAVAYKVRGGEIEAVQNVSFTLREGESFGLVGESGCGKSTVAWSLVNFLGRNGYVKRGSIQFMGEELTGRSNEELRQLRGDRITMVFQDPMQALNPSMRLGDQLNEVLTVHQNVEEEEARERSMAMLHRVHMPDPASVMRRYPHQISGGQQQRVVIAMALLNNPSLLIMDEPTTALDVTVEAAVLDLIAELREDFNTAILYISHNLGVVARVCKRVGVMYAGEMVEQADVRDVFANPRHPYTQGLIRCVPKLGADKAASTLYPIPGRVPPPNDRPEGCVFAPRCDYVEDRCWAERPVLRRLPGSVAPGHRHAAACHFAEEIVFADWTPPANSLADGTEVLVEGDIHLSGTNGTNGTNGAVAIVDAERDPIIMDVDGLKKYYEAGRTSLFGEERFVKAVDDVTFTVPRGMTLGIVGESGCGKSTLVKTIIGLENATAGKADFMGFDVTEDLGDRSTKLIRELQMVFQNPDSTMNPSYTVGQQIGRPLRRFGTVPNSEVRGEVIKLLQAVRLGENYYNRLPRQLSGGEKQRVGIARALASRPELVLCDEPVSALDVSVQAAVLNLLLDLQKQYGTTMLFIAHDLSVVRFFSDYVAVMYLGHIMEIGKAADIYAPPYHPYTEALLSAVPIADPTVEQKRIRLEGNVPSAIDPPSGCPFHTRCPRRTLLPDNGAICETETPPWREAGDGHRIFCHVDLETLSAIDPVIQQPAAEPSSL